MAFSEGAALFRNGVSKKLERIGRSKEVTTNLLVSTLDIK
jgi:hypothetical protein